MKKPAIRVMSVDDHAFLTDGLHARLDVEDDMALVGRLASAGGLVAEANRVRADVVLLDIEMPGPDPFEALAELRRLCPDVRAIMLSAYVRDHYIDAAYKAGAWGYLLKSDPSDAIVEGIRCVMRGKLAFSPDVERRSQPVPDRQPRDRAQPVSRLGLLTTREQQILRMMARGMSRTDIAAGLSRSPMTIDNHRKSIMKKLEIKDRTELVRYAIAEGLVEI